MGPIPITGYYSTYFGGPGMMCDGNRLLRMQPSTPVFETLEAATGG